MEDFQINLDFVFELIMNEYELDGVEMKNFLEQVEVRILPWPARN